MNKKKIFESVVASALCVAMVLSIILGALFLMPATEIQAASSDGNNFNFDFKKDDGSKVSISFLGDSITTYSGVSNNTSYNSTIGSNAVYYGRTTHPNYQEFSDVLLNDTWWMQAINTLDMELCVNNSWSGSRICKILRDGYSQANVATDQASTGYYTRWKQLSNTAGEKPDIIVVFLGTNDCGSRETLSNSAGNTVYGPNMFSAVSTNYKTENYLPSTVVGAYATMIRRMMDEYPDAEIYCCSLLPQEDERFSNNKEVYDTFNAGVKEIVDYYNDPAHAPSKGGYGYHEAGIYLVDFFNDSGIHEDKQSRENCYANRLHPNKNGMDALTNCLISALMEHSQYMGDNKGVTVDVTYDLANTYVEVGNVTSKGENMYGDVTRAVKYQPFQVQLSAKGDPNIQYRVTMGGTDITDDVVYENTISIPSVTDDIAITAHEFDAFYWGASETGLVSNPNNDPLVSSNTLTQFYPGGTSSYANGAVTFDNVGQAFKLNEPINLLYDRNWSIEMRMSGTFGSGDLLFSYSTTSMDYEISNSTWYRENNMYLFRTATDGMFAIGVSTQRDNEKTYTDSNGNEKSADFYYSYGVGLTNPDFGGTEGFDVTAMHTYRMFNVYERSTDTNKIYLSIDNGTPVEMGNCGMANTFGSEHATDTVESYNRDITFNSMGTWSSNHNGGYGHPLRNCSIEYIKVLENGNPVTYDDDINNYYWEFQSSGAVSNPEEKREFTDNELTVTKGTYTSGTLGSTDATGNLQLKLSEPAVLLASRPWIFEFQMNGTISGGILLTSDSPDASGVSAFDNTYIHINTTDVLFGYHNDTKYPAGSGVYLNKGFKFTEIATAMGSTRGQSLRLDTHVYRMENEVFSDGTNAVKLYVDETLIGYMFDRNSNWSGVDMVVNYFGSTNFPLRNLDLDYILIYENGIPSNEEDVVDNYRWEAKAEGMTTVEDDDYFTVNSATLKMGSGPYGVHEFPAYYSLARSVVLLHNRNWNVEWRASGSWGGTDDSGDDPMLFSSTKVKKKNMNYIWRNTNDLICMGYWTGTDGFYNYGIHLPSTSFGALNDDQMYTYRLENRVTKDSNGNYTSNMVYLYIDDVEIGAMNNFFKNNTNQNTTGDWISGKDFTFDYIGNEQFSLLDVNFEYIQVWEDGYKYDNSRLEYLIANQEARFEGVTDESWNNYQAAIAAGQEVMKLVGTTQSVIDSAVDEIIKMRNQLVIPSEETKFYSTELLTGDYARRGKQYGFKFVTTPDVAQICFGRLAWITCSSKIQKIVIDGQETTVKVWLGSLTYWYEDNQDYCVFGVSAWTDYAASGRDGYSEGAATTTSMGVHIGSRFVTGISIQTAPTKLIYSKHEKFDPTGMEVVATYNKPDAEGNYTEILDVDDLTIENPRISEDNTRIYINYQGARTYVDVDVQVQNTSINVSDVADANIGDFVKVNGYFVGYGYEGDYSELWMKDLTTSDLISVKLADYGDLSAYFHDYEVGNIISVSGYVETFSSHKRHLSISTVSAIEIIDNSTTTVSFDNAQFISISDWDSMKNSLKIDTDTPENTTAAYGYYQFTGTMYLIPVPLYDEETGDMVDIRFKLHMNQDYYNYDSDFVGIDYNDFWQCYYVSDALVGGDVFENHLRTACENSDYVNEIGLTWDDFVYDETASFEFTGTIKAVFIVNDVNGDLELSVLDSSWINIDADSIVVPEIF